jgi:hypothetical protein
MSGKLCKIRFLSAIALGNKFRGSAGWGTRDPEAQRKTSWQR